MALRASDRKNSFKKGIDADEIRRRRSETAIQIRKTAKENRLNQKRRMGGKETLSSIDEGPAAYFQQKVAELPQLVAEVHSPDINVQLGAVTKFRKLLSIERNPPITEVIQTGVVPLLVDFLKRADVPTLQFEAAWALTNIASGTSNDTEVVIQCGAIPIFCQLLSSPNDDVREQAVWALGNIAGDSIDCRDMVLSCGALQPLLQQLTESSKLSMLRNATWTLSNFCRGKPQPDFALVAPALPTLGQLIYTQDEEVLTDACWALSYLSDGSNEKIDAVVQAGVCRRVVELLMHPSSLVQTPALRTVGNIVTGNDLQTQIIINLSALRCLRVLLDNAKRAIRKEACWTLSNITAGNEEQIQAVIEADIFPTLISFLSSAEFDIRKEAAWAVSNATSGGSDNQIMHLVALGCIKPLCDLLEVADPKVVMVALEGIENILRVGDRRMTGEHNEIATLIDEVDGVTKIQSLQYHQNEEIYRKSLQIVELYFNGEEDAEENLIPTANASAQQFQFGAGGNQPNVFQFQ